MLKFLLFLCLLICETAMADMLYPVFQQNDVILFQGDSITDGGRDRTGNDPSHTMGQDYAYIISAELGAQIPGRNLRFINRGISGNKVTDLANRWQQDALALEPDILSILIGVNDTNSGIRAPQYEQVYDQLLSDTVTALPQTKIILCEPFMLPAGSHKATFGAIEPELKAYQAVVAQLAAKYHLPLVHFQHAFNDACRQAPPEYWIWDGVHPTYAGDGLMAREWLRVVSQAWPAQK